MKIMLLISFLSNFKLFSFQIIFKFSTEKSFDLSENNIYIKFPLGESSSYTKVYLTFTYDYTYITSKSINGTYDEKKYKSYKKLQDEISHFYRGPVSSGYKSSEILYLTKYSNEIFYPYHNFTFILAKDWNEDYEGLKTGEIGLTLCPDIELRNLCFIQKLKDDNITKSYVFSIKYNNDNEGEFIIGDYPHNFISNYLEENFRFTRIEIGIGLKWKITVDDIKYNNYYLKEKIIEFQINLNIIYAPEEFKNLIDENLFNEKINKSCFKGFSDLFKYEFYYCNSSNIKNNFSKVFFINRELNTTFELGYNDLFIEKNNIFYFLIGFRKGDKNWILGKPFFKKYQIIFDSEKKIIGLYNIKNNKFPIIPLIVILFLIIIIIIQILYYKKNLNKKRKKRMNEIEETFEYLPQN